MRDDEMRTIIDIRIRKWIVWYGTGAIAAFVIGVLVEMGLR